MSSDFHVQRCELNLRTLHCLFDQSHVALQCSITYILTCFITMFSFSAKHNVLKTLKSVISRPHPSLPTHSLSGEAQFYLGMALSQNTKKSYSSVMRQFYSSYSQTGLTPTFPINEDILINFSVCMTRSVTQYY